MFLSFLYSVPAIAEPPCPELSLSATPYEHAECWPFSVGSSTHPLLVHSQEAGDATMAAGVLALLEETWSFQVDDIGFREPLSDSGTAGPDDRFDVYLWRGLEEGYVAPIEGNPSTAEADRSAYMAIDPWGAYGGSALPATVAHEFNHACQAAYSWSGHTSIYESTATLVETESTGTVAPVAYVFRGFQRRPHWSLTRNDRYRTWYMYGAAFYLMVLRDHTFAGDLSFLPALWERMAALSANPFAGGADFVDALDGLLNDEAGSSFEESVLTLARWRWYTGAHDDGLHVGQSAAIPEVASTDFRRGIERPRRIPLRPRPRLFGSRYVELERGPFDSDPATLVLRRRRDIGARFVIQALPGPGGTDAETLEFNRRRATLHWDATGTRTLVVTALPFVDEAYDPYARRQRRARVHLALR